MQTVMHLVKALQAAGIAVPPFPHVDVPERLAAGLLPTQAEQVADKLLQNAIEDWREDVAALHRMHCVGHDEGVKHA